MSNEDYGYILDMVIRKDLVKKLGDIYKNELIDKNELDKITPICAPLSYNDDNIDFDELFNILDDIDSDTDSDKDSENGDSICDQENKQNIKEIEKINDNNNDNDDNDNDDNDDNDDIVDSEKNDNQIINNQVKEYKDKLYRMSEDSFNMLCMKKGIKNEDTIFTIP